MFAINRKFQMPIVTVMRATYICKYTYLSTQLTIDIILSAFLLFIILFVRAVIITPTVFI